MDSSRWESVLDLVRHTILLTIFDDNLNWIDQSNNKSRMCLRTKDANGDRCSIVTTFFFFFFHSWFPSSEFEGGLSNADRESRSLFNFLCASNVLLWPLSILLVIRLVVSMWSKYQISMCLPFIRHKAPLEGLYDQHIHEDGPMLSFRRLMLSKTIPSH